MYIGFLCYTGPMYKVPPQHRRIQQGEKNFKKYVIPRIQDRFNGAFFSTNGLECDYTHGIDFIHVHGHQVQTISARVWMSMDHSNFTARWYRTSDPARKLEYTSRMEAYKTGGYLSDWTIEAFIHPEKIAIGAIPTLKLYQHLDMLGDLCPVFIVQNKEDSVYFKKVKWWELHDDMVKWYQVK